MISFQQQMKLALLVKISRKTAQELCDADGVNFLCKVTEIQPRAVCKVIWKLVRTMVQCYLQRMVLNGRKYKSVTSPQVDLQVTISWGNVLTLRVTRVETCRLKSCKRLAFTIETLSLEHIRKSTITEASLLLCARGVTVSDDMPCHIFWPEKWGMSLCKQAIWRNHFSEILRFLLFDKKSDRSQSLKTDKFALFLVVG